MSAEMRKLIDMMHQLNLNENVVKGNIDEALPVQMGVKYTKYGQERSESVISKLNEIFEQLSKLDGAQTSKRGDRVYFKLEDSNVDVSSPLKKQVERILNKAGFTLKDYTKGIAIDRHKREMRLGKVLQMLNYGNLLDKIASDTEREGAKITDQYIVFSKHPYDIAGMSTNRGWRSCLTIGGDDRSSNSTNGGEKKYVESDIIGGSFICYSIRSNDMNINNPMARMVIKPFLNVDDPEDIIYIPDKRYGTSAKNFVPTVQKIVASVQKIPIGRFELKPSLSCDTGISKRFVPDQEPETKDEIKNLLKILNISQYKINPDLSVDVDGNVALNSLELSKFPIKFNNITGNFDCSNNRLVTLSGGPKYVGGSYNCKNNPKKFTKNDVIAFTQVDGEIYI